MEESSGWRVLVGSLWTAILALSILGLFAPERYAPVLLLQFVYKTIWLLVYAAPRLLRREYASIPWGIVVSFAAVVVVWPFIIPWSALFAEPDEKALGSCSAERRQIASHHQRPGSIPAGSHRSLHVSGRHRARVRHRPEPRVGGHDRIVANLGRQLPDGFGVGQGVARRLGMGRSDSENQAVPSVLMAGSLPSAGESWVSAIL